MEEETAIKMRERHKKLNSQKQWVVPAWDIIELIKGKKKRSLRQLGKFENRVGTILRNYFNLVLLDNGLKLRKVWIS